MAEVQIIVTVGGMKMDFAQSLTEDMLKYSNVVLSLKLLDQTYAEVRKALVALRKDGE